uniref:F-box protein At1g67623 family n=1 Tax=Cajanus cajan TaxID=3821 RepID=A0A151TTL2_CAJCA|nr:Putative F-box protein At1g67623 family [Cajanus cajan]
MLVEVVARVASDSVDDLRSIKKCCKDFLDASEDKHVWQQVSLDKFSLVQWLPNHKALSFLQRCKESGNTEILYREALREFFSYPNGNISALKMVAKEDHMEAKYVYGMILLCSHDDNLRKEGLEYMRFLRKSKCIIKCRNNVKKFANDLVWKGKEMLVHNEIPLCGCKNTCKGWRLKKGVWLFLDDDEDDISLCENCRWDHEVNFFYRLFNVC